MKNKKMSPSFWARPAKNIYAQVNPNAWIVKNNRANSSQPNDRGRVKIYPNNTVYLEDGQEFEIELFNPLTVSVLCIIKVQNNLISKNGLVVRPGERVYLDCFIDSRKKFKYNTYNIDDSKESKKAISFNGLIDIDFYREEVVYNQEYPNFDWSYTNIGLTNTGTHTAKFQITPNNTNYNNTLNQSVGNTLSLMSGANTGGFPINGTFNSQNSLVQQSILSQFKSTKIETGRIESGSSSNMSFKMVNNTFEKYKMGSISYKILPLTTKPLTSDDIKQKIYCTKCGRKSKKDENFCPSCGSKLV